MGITGNRKEKSGGACLALRETRDDPPNESIMVSTALSSDKAAKTSSSYQGKAIE
jgi:hypothetical protein